MASKKNKTRYSAGAVGTRPICSTIRRDHSARIKLLTGVHVDLIPFDEAFDWLIRSFQGSGKSSPVTVAFLNFHTANCFRRDRDFRKALASFDHVFPDGVGLRAAALLHGCHPIPNVPGTDLIPALLDAPELAGLRVFLLGDEPGFIENVALQFPGRFPALRLVGYHHGFFGPEQDHEVIERINAKQVDILLVGMGTPKQEKWLYNYSPLLESRVQVVVGSLFLYWDGRLKRAPRFVRQIGLEWAWILIQQPHKWRRYVIGGPLFLWWVLKTALWEIPFRHEL